MTRVSALANDPSTAPSQNERRTHSAAIHRRAHRHRPDGWHQAGSAHRHNRPARPAVISNGLRGSALTAASLPANPRRRSACPSNTTPASDVMRPPSKAAVIFLRSTAGNENGRRLSSVMADMAWMRLREGSASATNPYIKSRPYATSASRNPSSVELRGANTLRGYGHNHAPFFCKFCVDR
jgi:hypothetical protein